MTIKDISSKTGYSVATVSRVLNNSESVSPKTQQLVSEAIQELGYVPNTLGRNLRTLKTQIVLVILPGIDNPFFSAIVKGIELKAEEADYTVLVCDTRHQYEKIKGYFEFIPQKKVDGIIFVSPQGHEDYFFIEGQPVVVCCESRKEIKCPQVDIDNVQAGYDATMHLIGQNRKRIAFVGGGIESASGLKREKGYRRAIKDAGMSIDESIIMKPYYDFDGGLRAAKQLFSLENPPDAIFTISDAISIGVINEAQSRGIRVPKDLMVVGFDNIDFSLMINPALTTVEQPCIEMGSKSMELLLQVMDGKKGEDARLKHTLIARASTAV